MTELIELRVFEEHANSVFRKDEGERLRSGIRKVVIRSDDPRIPKIIEIHEELRKQRAFLFAGSGIIRRYSPEELDSATLLVLLITCVFEPAGEGCGTVYDESTACPVCGAGSRQSSELFLDLRRVPRSKDCGATIAAVERVVSQRFVDCIKAHKLSGLEVHPVQRCIGLEASVTASAGRATWYQLAVTSQPVDIVRPTRIGKIPFWELPPECPLGHFTGRWPLSEISIARSSWDGSDFVQSRQRFGVRRGLLRPFPVLFVTQRVHQLLKEQGLRGFRFEVAHFV